MEFPLGTGTQHSIFGNNFGLVEGVRTKTFVVQIISLQYFHKLWWYKFIFCLLSLYRVLLPPRIHCRFIRTHTHTHTARRVSHMWTSHVIQSKSTTTQREVDSHNIHTYTQTHAQIYTLTHIHIYTHTRTHTRMNESACEWDMSHIWTRSVTLEQIHMRMRHIASVKWSCNTTQINEDTPVGSQGPSVLLK